MRKSIAFLLLSAVAVAVLGCDVFRALQWI